MPGEAPARDPSGAAFKPLDVALFALTVLFWGCGWYALRLQLGVVPPEVSVAYRFAIAALVFFVWAAIKGDRLVFPLRTR